MLIRIAIVINLLWFGCNALAKTAEGDEVIWQAQTDNFTIRWSTGDITVTDQYQETIFSAAALANKQFTANFLSEDQCEYKRNFTLLSVVGTIASLQDSENFSCQNTPHPTMETRFMSIDLAKAGRKVKLTDRFAEADILKALLADAVIKSALEQAKPPQLPTTLKALYDILEWTEISVKECSYYLPTDFLNQFALHHVKGNQIAVRVKLQPLVPACQTKNLQLGFYLPIPANFRAAIQQAQTGKVGFLMQTSPTVTHKKMTQFQFSTQQITAANHVTDNAQPSPAKSILQRIITVSQARLRSKATLNSQVLAKLPLGMIVKQLTRSQQPERINQVTDYWYQITTPTGKNGWIFGDLTQSFEPQQRATIYQQLVKSRQTKPLNLLEQIELTDLLERAQNEIANPPQVAAELAWSHLSSLQKVVEQIDEQLPHQAWLAKQKQQKWLYYDEIQGRWLVNVKRGWQLHAEYYPLPVADQLAWLAATMPLGGECEGWFECHLSALDQTVVRYLKYHPTGNQVELALKQLIQFLDNSLATPQLNLTTADRELPRLLAVLQATLEKVNSPQQTDLLVKVTQLQTRVTTFLHKE
jgi:uncharacterized protein YgiM (DUF1202 family)